MTAQPVTIPTTEIIDDLLIDNWELRWQVLDIFYQTHDKVRNFAKSSPYHRSIVKLCEHVISLLQGENDVNLHLILLAVYLLDGLEGTLRVFKKIEIANPPTDPEKFQLLEKKVLRKEPNYSFFNYFLFLFQENLSRDSTLNLSLKLFEAEELLKLFSHISNPQQQALSFKLLRQEFPQTNFNGMLISNDLQMIKENPELITCLKPPLEPDIFKQVETLALSHLAERQHLESMLEACGRLKIQAAVPHIKALLQDKDLWPLATSALGQIGTEIGMEVLIASSRSLFTRKKVEAAMLLAHYHQQPAAIECLIKLGTSHNRKVRKIALASLARTGHPQALNTLINQVMKAPAKSKKALLAVIARSKWSNVPETQAEKIVSLAEDSSLGPEIFQALKAMGHEDFLLSWFNKLEVPLRTDYHKEACLFLAEYAAIPAVKKALLSHLQHPDWGFSYRLLCKLSDSFVINDFPCLLKLLELRESYKPLTIKERLELGKGDEEFIPAMCHYLNQHPQVARQLLFTINNHLLTRKPPLKVKEFEEVLSGHPDGLKQLITESPFEQQNVPPEAVYVLLLFCRYLDEITVDGSSCFAIIVNMTRKYSGFFAETIWSIIMRILQAERTSTDTAILPYLDQILEILRGRQNVEELRSMVITIKKRIFSLSRDLIVYIESNRYRDLQVFKVKKIHG